MDRFFQIIASCDSLDGAVLKDVLLSRRAPDKMAQAAAQTRTERALLRRLYEWADGFQTLKVIHALRDACCPNIPWAQALEQASCCGDEKSTWETIEDSSVELRRMYEEISGVIVGPTAALDVSG